MYIYRADLWCVDCAHEVMENLPKPEGMDPDNEHTWDSDNYPKGPYPAEEADCPQHCAGCGIFLENPLTKYGRNYVAASLVNPAHESPLVNEWAEHYCPEYGWLNPAELSEREQKALRKWADSLGSPAYALEKWWEAYRGIHASPEEYAFQLAEDTGMWDLRSPIGHYFDAEAFARDLELSGDCIFIHLGHASVAVFDNHV